MMAEWIGSYNVQHKVNEYNYEIQLPKRKTILQINMLKKYHERCETVGAVLVAEADEPKDEVRFPNRVQLEEQDNIVQMGEHLVDRPDARQPLRNVPSLLLMRYELQN